MKDCVRLHSEQRADGKICGELLIKRGLKRRARKRKLVIDHEMKEVLERLLKDSQRDYVFTSPQDRTKPLGPWVLEEQISQIRKKIKTHPDAGLHALRHTFLTEAGEYTDPFTLQYVAGHDNIKTTMRQTYARRRLQYISSWGGGGTCNGLRNASRVGSRCQIQCSRKCFTERSS
jgi:integrase